MSESEPLVEFAGASGAAITAPAAEPRLSLVTRLVDRLNPILVREVQQSLNGKAFLSTLAVSLMGVVVVGLTASGGVSRGESGFSTFVLALQLLTPIIVLAVPMVAFLSMRQEVTAGTVEHLLLSKLGPGVIVRGKLYASLVQLVLFLAVFGPLIGMTYLLRGVDVPTIVEMLGLAGLAGFVACAFGIMMGALSRWQAVRALPLLVTAAALVLACVGLEGGMSSIVTTVSYAVARANSGELGLSPLGMAWAPAAVSVVLFSVTAAASLAHPNENRSTVFRVLAVLLFVSAIAWMTWMDQRFRRLAGSGRSDLEDIAPWVSIFFAWFLIPWWYFASTEAEPLSVRVRTRVPKHRVLAFLAAPWLPGGGRGYLFSILLAAFACASAAYVPWIFADQAPKEVELRRALGTWAYVAAYAGIIAFVRRRFPPTSRGTVVARLLSVPGLVLLTLLPSLIDLVRGGLRRSWSVIDAVNPFRTLDRIASDVKPTAIWLVLAAAATGFVFAVPSMVRGFAEVLAASAERRRRAR